MAMLALGEPVPPDRLIDVLWPEYDEAAPARLQVYISQWRGPAAEELGSVARRLEGFNGRARVKCVRSVRRMLK